jgi:hypothetical protein
MTKARLGSVPKSLAWIAERGTQHAAPESVKALAQQIVLPEAQKIELKIEPIELEPVQPAVIAAPLVSEDTNAVVPVVTIAPVVVPEENRKEKSKSTDSARMGLSAGWSRSTVIMREGYIHQLKVLASLQNESIKEVLDQALERFFKSSDIRSIYIEELEKRK